MRRGPFLQALRYGIGIGVLVGIAFLAVEYMFVSAWGNPNLNTIEKVLGLSYKVAFVWSEYAFFLTFLVLIVQEYFWPLDE